MERGLKERLVGAVVLVMLGVIFIPMLLDDSPMQTARITDTNIPPAPDREFSSRIIPAMPEPVTPAAPIPAATPAEEPPTLTETPPAEAVPDTTAAAPATAPAAAQPAPSPPDSPQLTADMPKPATGDAAQAGAWVVQLASLSSQENAEALSKKLQAGGFKAYVEPTRSSGKTMYRVRVGPEVLRADAERIRDQIKAAQDIEGFVVSYP